MVGALKTENEHRSRQQNGPSRESAEKKVVSQSSREAPKHSQQGSQLRQIPRELSTRHVQYIKNPRELIERGSRQEKFNKAVPSESRLAYCSVGKSQDGNHGSFRVTQRPSKRPSQCQSQRSTRNSCASALSCVVKSGRRRCRQKGANSMRTTPLTRMQ